jgi:hypothetical protein
MQCWNHLFKFKNNRRARITSNGYSDLDGKRESQRNTSLQKTAESGRRTFFKNSTKHRAITAQHQYSLLTKTRAATPLTPFSELDTPQSSRHTITQTSTTKHTATTAPDQHTNLPTAGHWTNTSDSLNTLLKHCSRAAQYVAHNTVQTSA